ncbi:hypothetical protein MRB53_027979 [Persea americana]|uniref:Uncharacterized protein n=1 Tax=Persea americana TaxID=3435 RepID=A0ACC2KEQ6_PERAE|nr:hypothetical protein MRB53_027979 [Persea americana]
MHLRRNNRFDGKNTRKMKKEKRKRLMRILKPRIVRMVREELKLQSHHSGHRPSINQIQACDALFLDFQLRSSWPNIFYTNTSMSPFNIVIRRGNSEEPVVTGPLSSIRVEMVVLSGDFAQEDWTEVEFKDNVVGAREGKGPLLKGNAITALTGGVGTFDDIKLTDNSSWTRSASFRLGAKVVHGNGIQDRIREARSEAFVVREKPRQSSWNHDYPSLADDIWRLKNIRINGAYHARLHEQGIGTTISMKNKKWEETLRDAQKCTIIDNKYYMYFGSERKFGLLFNSIYEVVGSTFDGCQSFQILDHLPTSKKNQVEILKKQACANQNEILEYNERPLFCPFNPSLEQQEDAFIEEASSNPQNTDVITLQSKWSL